jgi:crotonobetainyl-CoA:carnitine CoA-transferase CaiB-like acyl-CoA transferase
MGYPQAAFHAGAQAAADAIIALNERELSGRGQWLDTSMQEVMIWTLLGPGWYPAAIGEDYPGVGEDRSKPQLPRSQRLFPALSPCRDGYVVAALGPGAPGTKGVLPFLLEEQALRGELDEELRDIDWANWTEAFRTREISDDQVRVAVRRAEEILRSRTKRELFEWAVQNDLRLAPVHTTRDLLEDPQLRVRGFFREIEGRLHPSASLCLSRSPTPLRRGAPSLGSNQEVLESWLREPPAPADPAPSGDRPGEAFAGLRVADLSWVVTGPTIGKALADCGATVVRVESSRRIDLLRQLPPFKDGQPGPNRSFWMATYNTSKLSASVNLSTEAGRVLARRIVDWADVVIESFSPGTMRKLGLDYETLTRDRDDLIMLSTSLLGQTGPLASYAGYGQQGVALAGLQAVTGWPDRAPCGPFGPYTDVIAPKYGIAALGAAILERRRSGLGQYIDLSQVESSIHFIEPLVLDESVNGRTAGAAGLDSATACPHGIYATRETERYIAIAVETSEQWRDLCTLAPLAAFSGDAYADIASRKRVRDEIDRELRAWCVKESCRDLEARLVAGGVPAAVVQRPLDLHEDPQLEHRGFHTVLDHTELGPILLEGFPTRFSAKPEMLRSAAPCLGEHTDYVLRELLHMTPAEIQEFRNANALS